MSENVPDGGNLRDALSAFAKSKAAGGATAPMTVDWFASSMHETFQQLGAQEAEFRASISYPRFENGEEPEPDVVDRFFALRPMRALDVELDDCFRWLKRWCYGTENIEPNGGDDHDRH